MRILYVARHGKHDNWDEDAIARSLEQLGHLVLCLFESDSTVLKFSQNSDLCLFHNWPDVGTIEKLQCPAVCWFFDKVWCDDPLLVSLYRRRRNWMYAVAPLCRAVFCTDGDWVAEHAAATNEDGGQLYHQLMQGADERVIGYGDSANAPPRDILFFGNVKHGQKRQAHYAAMKARYGDRFHVIGADGPRHRLHRRELADAVAASKVVVALDGVQTDRYWSSRVYQTLGFGGFLLHPYCEQLLQHYDAGQVAFYMNHEACSTIIDHALDDTKLRQGFAARGMARTIKEHTYRKRCERLIEIVREGL